MTGATGATGATGPVGATGAGLTEVETVTSGGSGTALVGTLTAKLVTTGEYELADGVSEPVLKECAVVATVNESGAPHTAQAVTTGEHAITVMTYTAAVPADASFSLMVTCP